MKKWQDIEGWLTEEEGAKLQELCKDKSIIEVGSYKGRSTACIAEVAKLVYSIDTHKALDDGQEQLKEGMVNLETGDKFTTWKEFRHNTGSYTNIIPFCNKLTYWADILPKVDVAFIDGDHTPQGVKGDIDLLRGKAKLFIFHDYDWMGVRIICDNEVNIQGKIDHLAWGVLK